jgi:hypothetical protein
VVITAALSLEKSGSKADRWRWQRKKVSSSYAVCVGREV